MHQKRDGGEGLLNKMVVSRGGSPQRHPRPEVVKVSDVNSQSWPIGTEEPCYTGGVLKQCLPATSTKYLGHCLSQEFFPAILSPFHNFALRVFTQRRLINTTKGFFFGNNEIY